MVLLVPAVLKLFIGKTYGLVTVVKETLAGYGYIAAMSKQNNSIRGISHLCWYSLKRKFDNGLKGIRGKLKQ